MMDSRYFEPATVEEACALLVERGEGAKVVAGGQSLALLLRRALIDPSCLVSVQNVAGLDHITASQEGVKIGAMVALHSLESAGDEEPALGPGGVITPLSNPRATAEACVRLLTEPDWYRQCAETIRTRVERYYDKLDQDRRYRGLYEECRSLPTRSIEAPASAPPARAAE